MKVVVALAVREEGEHGIVARAVLIRVGPGAPHVRQRVDEKGEVVTDDHAQQARQDERAPHVSDQQARADCETEIDDERNRQIVTLLKGEERIALQIARVGKVGIAARVVAQHPADVREPEAAPRRVRILVVVVDMQVMYAMTAAPHERAVLQRHRTEYQIDDLQNRMRFIGTMRPQAMVARRDRHAAGDEKERKHGPGAGAEAVHDAIPRYEHRRRERREDEHNRGRPVDRRLRFGGLRLRHGACVRVLYLRSVK